MKINVETAARCIVGDTYALNRKTMDALRIVVMPPCFNYHKYYIPTYNGEEAIHLVEYYFAGGRYLFGYGMETNTVVIKEFEDELGDTLNLLDDLSSMLNYIENQY